jgi:ArsR family transcriptional regulator, cadmium/lead-responsive transcriptional repressor
MFSVSCTVLYMLSSETREAALSRLGRALADPTRCRILVSLLEGPSYPGQLAADLGLTRSNVSNHLSCLRGCGLVVATYAGRQVRYELADAPLGHALDELLKVVLAVDPGRECLDEDTPQGAAAGDEAVGVL